MAGGKTFNTLDLSRRRLLSGVTLVLGGGAMVAAGFSSGPAAAKSKMPQITVSYRTTPRGKSRCDNCTQWQAPSSCKTVAGVIVPAGWCSLYERAGG